MADLLSNFLTQANTFLWGWFMIIILTGGKGIIFYRIAWVLLVYVGATQTLEMVWDFSDIFNALMLIPNVIALIWLSRVIRDETKVAGKL